MASLSLAQGRYADVVERLVPVENAFREVFSSADTDVLSRFLLLLGQAYTNQGEYAAAESKLLEANAFFVEFPCPNPQDVRRSIQAMIELYTAWQKAMPGKEYETKASEWTSKLNELDTAPSAGAESPTAIATKQ